ncbi:MAG TPA: aldo/keto reductase [Methylibium sp.]|uniref:aldo/keto reductase n=1 Tax=Methylibium sp. TaxID=2067992 RepID=UPI002DB69D86|nr:aldo/keto reductase [Methylibium sp.]HEU4460186.1 aldo/keto reductase [Methylibium sp.]
MTVAPRRIGPFTVPALGLGCMNLSHAYGTPPSAPDGERLLLEALDAGITLFDTAALYGFGANETLVGRTLKAHRSRIVLCSKGGMVGETFPDGVRRVIDGRPASLRAHCEASLKRLQTDVIDLYYLHRWDKRVPIEDSVGELSRLVEAGKVRAIGLSEVSAATLAKAHAVHPIAALQTEYSLWTRNPEIAVLEACRAMGIAFVAFSPLGRGFLTGAPPVPSEFDANDIRRTMPRFAADVWAHQLELHRGLGALAEEAGASVAQLALAWLFARGEHVLPIPGTRRVEHLHDNVGALHLEARAELVERAGAIIDRLSVRGARYSAATQKEIDTEEFEPLD